MTIWRCAEFYFSCAHFYQNADFSEQENRENFGRCYTTYGHGHDYRLIARHQGSQDQFLKLKDILWKLREKLDHQHLNFVIPEFKNQIPTSENLLKYFIDQIGISLQGSSSEEPVELELWETPTVGARALINLGNCKSLQNPGPSKNPRF